MTEFKTTLAKGDEWEIQFVRKGDKDDNGWRDFSRYQPKVGVDYMLELTDRNEFQFNGCGYFSEDGKMRIYSPKEPLLLIFCLDDFVEIKFKEWK